MLKKGCVLLHGFTGSPHEIQLLADHLEAEGIKVSTPILKGHNFQLKRKDMRNVTWSDWLHSAEEAVVHMQKRVDELYLVGFSMGGLIAAYLATKYPIKKLVLLSASVYYLNAKELFKERKKPQLTKDQLSRYFYKIKGTPLKSVLQFKRLVKELVPQIKYITCPTLIIQGEQDDLVHPKSAQYIYDTIKSEEKYLHYLPKSKHIVCLDCEKDQVIELTNQFMFGKVGER